MIGRQEENRAIGSHGRIKDHFPISQLSFDMLRFLTAFHHIKFNLLRNLHKIDKAHTQKLIKTGLWNRDKQNKCKIFARSQ